MLKRYITDTIVLDLTSYVQSHNLVWSDINLYVKINQKKIYEFSYIGDTLKVHYFQKQLFISKQARPDIHPTISVLCVRVKSPN